MYCPSTVAKQMMTEAYMKDGGAKNFAAQFSQRAVSATTVLRCRYMGDHQYRWALVTTEWIEQDAAFNVIDECIA